MAGARGRERSAALSQMRLETHPGSRGVPSAMRRDGLALGLCLGQLLRRLGLAYPRLCETRVSCDAGVLLAEVLKHILRDTRAEGAVGCLRFHIDLRHFRGELLAERGAIELQEPLNFVVAEMLVVNGDQLTGSSISIEFGLVVVNKGVHKFLTTFVIGNRSCQILSELIGTPGGCLLQGVTRAYQLHQRTDIGFLCGIDRRRLRRGLMPRWLDGVLRSAMRGDEKRSDVNNDECQNRLHDCLRGETLSFRHAAIVGKTAVLRHVLKYRNAASFTVRP